MPPATNGITIKAMPAKTKTIAMMIASRRKVTELLSLRDEGKLAELDDLDNCSPQNEAVVMP